MTLMWVDQAQWNWLIAAVARIDRSQTQMLVLVNDLSQRMKQLTSEVETKMTAMDDAVTTLTTQVTANTDAEASAVTLIQQLAVMISASASDPTAVTALADKLKASADALAAAVTANTPHA